MIYLDFGLCLLILLLAIAAGRQGGWPRKGLLATVAGLFLWSWPPAAALLAGTLEWHFPVRPFPADAQAIVVLGGSVYQRDASQPVTSPGYSTFLRCQHAAWLYRNWKPLPIVVSGGAKPGGDPSALLADVMAHMLEREGVPRSMIWMEQASRSTFENALYTARLLRLQGIHRIALVTEAYHMLRADGCFRKQALEVSPAPFAYRTRRFRWNWQELFPSADAMLLNEDSLHEWAGWVWYRLSGKL